MQIIGWVRVVNSGMTALQAGIGALTLPEPWNIIAPLVVGVSLQVLAEVINQLSGSLIKQETPTQVLVVDPNPPEE